MAVLDLTAFDPMVKEHYSPFEVARMAMQRNKATGMHHDRALECAWACVRWEGQPVGLLTRDGKIYQLAGGLVANSNARIAPHLAHTVTVTGDVTEVDGVLTVSSNELTLAK